MMAVAQHVYSIVGLFRTFLKQVGLEDLNKICSTLKPDGCSYTDSSTLLRDLQELLNGLEKILLELQGSKDSCKKMSVNTTHSEPANTRSRTRSKECLIQTKNSHKRDRTDDSLMNIIDGNNSQESCDVADEDKDKVKGIKSSNQSNTGCSSESKKPRLDPELVQIRADNKEIERRIAAFIDKKQTEVDEGNKREFCSMVPTDIGNGSCARVDAMFVPRAGSKSHVKVSRVFNPYGPQTRHYEPKPEPGSNCHTNNSPHKNGTGVEIKTEKPSVGVEERLCNMEIHLKFKTGHRSNTSVYERLQKLEDRILHLESLSPEYFQSIPPPQTTQRHRSEVRHRSQMFPKHKGLSMLDVEERMEALKNSLNRKLSKDIKTEVNDHNV